MADIQPVPQWALPFLGNKEEMEKLGLKFNPVWLKWFIDLIDDGQLGLFATAQNINTVFAGPATGSAALATFRALVTADLSAQMVTYAKIQNVTDVRLLGRSAGSAGSPMEITVGTGLSLAAGALTSTITQYTNEMAQDAVGGILTDTGTIDFTYNDAGDTITADVKTSFATSGVYTPTLTNVTNIDASTAYPAQYLRVGSSVTVSGMFDIDPTAAVATELGVSLPIASNFAQLYQCNGTANATAVQQAAGIVADAANDRASVRFLATSLINQTMSFTFTYQVI